MVEIVTHLISCFRSWTANGWAISQLKKEQGLWSWVCRKSSCTPNILLRKVGIKSSRIFPYVVALSYPIFYHFHHTWRTLSPDQDGNLWGIIPFIGKSLIHFILIDNDDFNLQNDLCNGFQNTTRIHFKADKWLKGFTVQCSAPWISFGPSTVL